MSETDLEEALGFDFSNMEDSATEASSGPLTGSRGTRKSTPARRTSTRLAKRLDALQKRLSTEMFSAGAMLGMGLPVTGYYVCQESDGFTKAVVELASKRPEWIDALENVAAIQPGIVIGKTILGIGAAIAVDRERVQPDRKFLMFLGVYSAYMAVNEPDNSAEVVNSGIFQPPPAGAFVPV